MPILASTNSIKIEEVREIVGPIETMAIDIPEIQDVAPATVVRSKLDFVKNLGLDRPVVVEDTGLHMDGWNSLPGALIKWFVQGIALDDLHRILSSGGSAAATAVSAVGVIHQQHYAVWEGRLRGRMVPPRGELGGWTSLFEIDGVGLTLAELTLAQRLEVTMRRRPLEQLRAWLNEFGECETTDRTLHLPGGDAGMGEA